MASAQLPAAGTLGRSGRRARQTSAPKSSAAQSTSRLRLPFTRRKANARRERLDFAPASSMVPGTAPGAGSCSRQGAARPARTRWQAPRSPCRGRSRAGAPAPRASGGKAPPCSSMDRARCPSASACAARAREALARVR